MSSTTHAAKDDGQVHAHISSAPFYGLIFLALIGLTILTVGQSYVDLGKLNLVVVILIATTKASLVVSFFMHLRYDNKFNALIFISCLFFIGVFFAYTTGNTNLTTGTSSGVSVAALSGSGTISMALPSSRACGGSVPSSIP